MKTGLFGLGGVLLVAGIYLLYRQNKNKELKSMYAGERYDPMYGDKWPLSGNQVIGARMPIIGNMPPTRPKMIAGFSRYY